VYLKDLLVLNSGALSEFALEAEFHSTGAPKPILLVGSNGTGKTALLSLIADALTEIAARELQDVTPTKGANRRYYRIFGGSSIRVGSDYELTLAKFASSSDEFYFRSNAGILQPADVADKITKFAPVAQWQPEVPEKCVVGPVGKVPSILRDGVYAFFPANRSASPYWFNYTEYKQDTILFNEVFDKHLAKPIVVHTSFDDLKSWIMSLVADGKIDPAYILSGASFESIRQYAEREYQKTTLSNLNEVLSIIFQKQVRVARVIRGSGNRRICVAIGADMFLPTLENLSSGQASLFSIFSTVLRYGDYGDKASSKESLRGIVLIDEVDAPCVRMIWYRLPEKVKLTMGPQGADHDQRNPMCQDDLVPATRES